MKKIIYIGLAAGLLFSGCKGDLGGYDLGALEISPEERFSAKIHIVSNLQDAAIGSTDSDYAAISNYFNSTVSQDEIWLGIVERTDVNYSASGMKNYGVTIADDTEHWSVFCLQKIVNKTRFEGTTILTNNYLTSFDNYKLTDDCRIYRFSPIISGVRTDDDGTKTDVNFPVHYRYARFDTSAQVTAFAGTGEGGGLYDLKYQMMNMLMVGTIKKDLADSFVSAVKASDENFVVHIIDAGKDYCAFMLHEQQFWALRDSKTTSLGNGVEAVELDIYW